MVIRNCNANDIEVLTAFYDEVTLYLTNHVNYPLWEYGVYPSRQSVTAVVNKGFQYACFDGDKVVGAFVLNDDPQGSYHKAVWRGKKYLVVHTLATATECQNKGVATEMVNWCKTFAKANGCDSLRLDIVPENFPARSLYEKLGFKFLGDFDLDRNFDNIPLFSLFECML